jgi:glutaredoxin
MAFEKYTTKVQGKKRGDILLFALSTCGWCRKTKNLLDSLGVEYRYIDVDLLDERVKDEVKKEVTRWNPHSSFPTIVINNDKCIVGFQEEEIRKALGSGKD